MNERFTTLDQVVKDICEIGGDDYDHKSYGKVLKVCVNTLRGFNLYSSTPYVKTEEFEVMPNNTVLLPKNALDVVRVGKKDRCGEIEEIFYSKDLSMDAKNIEEHCQCSGKVQVIETIETGTGETLCDYRVEGIDLGSESTCDYIIPNANLTIYRNWIEIEFIEEFVYEGTWDENGYGNFYLQLNEGSGNDTYILYGNEIDSLSSFDNGFYTLKLKDVVDYFYSQYLISSNPTLPTMVIDKNKMLFTYTRFYLFPVFRINIENKSTNKTPNDLKDIFTYTTNSNSVHYSTDNSNYLMFNWSWQTTTYYVLYVNINGEWVDETSNVDNGTWSLNNTTDIVTTYELRNTTNYNPDFTGDVGSICEGGNSKSFEVLINGEWIDKTNEVTEQGIWELLNTTDEVTAWRYVDSEGEGEPTPIVGDCRVDLQRQEVSKWVDNNIECDTNGRCKSCGNFVPTYTTAWYGGWYSSAPIYSRQLAQSNLNLPNSGQAYYEQYTARPYPARWGFYNLDLAKGVMRLTHNFEHGEKVVIIYSTDMVEIEGAKVVAVEWFDMLLYRCKELIWNRNSVDGTRQRQLYEREYTRIKKIYNKTTQEEWRRAIMKVKYSGVKR